MSDRQVPCSFVEDALVCGVDLCTTNLSDTDCQIARATGALWCHGRVRREDLKIVSNIFWFMNYKDRQNIIAGSPISFAYLKRFNAAAGVLHLIHGILMLAPGFLLNWPLKLYTFHLNNVFQEG
jgi:hypothetical protein